MFAALMLVRLRESVFETEGLANKDAWVSEDDVDATDLPLARATEKVLASMHDVLTKTKEKRDEEIEKYNTRVQGRGEEDDKKRLRLVQSKAAELRLIRNLDALKIPIVKFRAERV
jgi:pyridoxine kinase